ncbi:diadenylate cyclase CdaA [Candidatus Caldatribacterium saccharofermentans]|uniref:Diadenylate cyclase n=1 Tax=Candidatus Caldatribacterium saccharofermentans TaxID=1454753 RepID=A0A7V4TIF1_9BACT
MLPGFLKYVVEIGVLYYFSYQLLRWVKGTPLFLPVRSLMVLFIAAGASNFLTLGELRLFWRLCLFVYVGTMLLILQPELRRNYMNRLYHHVLLERNTNEEGRTKFIEDLALACQTLSRKRIGALVVLERTNSLRDFTQTGVLVDAFFSPELLFSIFLPDSPLHDGAVIVRENKIIAAGCILPLAEQVEARRKIGTRHRAGIGVTEQTDALAIVISEETGKISLAVHGRMAWDIEAGTLKRMLKILYRRH